MTRKDYQTIADGFREAIKANSDAAVCGGIDAAINHVSVKLAEDNPRFDRLRFKNACYLGTGA